MSSVKTEPLPQALKRCRETLQVLKHRFGVVLSPEHEAQVRNHIQLNDLSGFRPSQFLCLPWRLMHYFENKHLPGVRLCPVSIVELEEKKDAGKDAAST